MRIFQIAPLEEPVPPTKYGGIELVVYNLVQEMTAQGHEVFLLGSGDSQVSGTVLPILPQSLRQTYSPQHITEWRQFFVTYYTAFILEQIAVHQPDVIFNHLSWHLVAFANQFSAPLINTVHGPLQNKQERYVFSRHPQAHYVSISNAQRQGMPDLNWVKTIYNGIELSRFTLGPATAEREYFVFLGRTSPEKGLKEICELIRKTDYQLKIGAKVDAVDHEYFEQEIKPLIDGTQIQFLGEVDHEQKVALLQKAKGLLLWLNWEEPFGLVVIEAMACGTPVITNKRGAMPELIAHERTGFLVDSLSAMRERLADVEKINPSACRHHVAQHFSAQKMALEYLALATSLTK